MHDTEGTDNLRSYSDMDIDHAYTENNLVEEDDTEDMAASSISEDEDIEDESEMDAKQLETISCLENLALSFLSQLAASLTQGNDSSNSQPNALRPPNRIILEMASRGKTRRSGNGEHKTRLVQFPRKGQGPSAKSPAQVLKVANEAHEALLSDAPMTKRDLFYRDVSLFKGQAIVDALVDDLAATFSVNRSDLNIRASSKGLFCGSALSAHLCDGTTVVGHDTQASLVPHGQDIVEFNISQDIAWILIVEKDAVFQTLRGAGLTNHPALPGPGVLITGKGYPDIATRQLVKTFSDNMPENTRILALVDADAYGLDIVSVYKYGSASLLHENEKLAAERVEWIGVSTGEALKMGLDRDALLPITVHDQRKALALLRPNNAIPPSWRRELMQMLHTRRKAEIEVLHALPTDRSSCDTEAGDPNVNLRATSVSSPLVHFVIQKISNALLS